jgi:hypothetical protein
VCGSPLPPQHSWMVGMIGQNTSGKMLSVKHSQDCRLALL